MFFAGGPGQSAIGLAGVIEGFTSRLGARRDLVLIDQRGTGHSAPLQCDVPTPDEALARALDRCARGRRARRLPRQAARSCPGATCASTRPPSRWPTPTPCAPRSAPSKLDLIGVSYGTRAALEYLRAYPTHVRRAVIDGVAPPDMVLPESDDIDAAAAMQALLRDCAAEKACAQAHPALAQRWDALLGLAAARDRRGRPGHRPAAQRRCSRPRRCAASCARPLYHAGARRDAAVRHRRGRGAGASSRCWRWPASTGGQPTDMSEGQHFSVICAEDVPRMPPASGRASDAGAQGPVPRRLRALAARRRAGGVLHDPRQPGAGAAAVRRPRPGDAAAPRRARGQGARRPRRARWSSPTTATTSLAIACMRDAVFRFVNAATDADGAGRRHGLRRQGAAPARVPAAAARARACPPPTTRTVSTTRRRARPTPPTAAPKDAR